MNAPHTIRAVTAGLGALALVAGLAACSTGDVEEGKAEAAGTAISAERCALNEAAGTVNFLTGYQYQASASILEIVAAKELGYFDALCLDVEIQPGSGDTGQNSQLIAANTVQFTAVSQQDLLLAADNGIEMVGISSYSTVGLDILMTNPDVTDLTDLDGTILGHKGMLPAAVKAMLDEAGADVDGMQQVTVGYDPTILPRGQVDSLTGFISNEPNLLAASGNDVTVWRPVDFGVPSSLGALAVNADFAQEHPTVVEDFLRGALKAFDYCGENGSECVSFTAELSGEGYDPEHNLKVWETEFGIVQDSRTDGVNLGAIDTANVESLHSMLSDYAMLTTDMTAEDAVALFDTSYIESIYADGSLVWPAP